MTSSNCLIVFLLVSSFACNAGNDQTSSQQKALELAVKETELLAREQMVMEKEAELLLREKMLDSISKKLPDSILYNIVGDTLSASRPQLPGLYNVTMRCTETNCSGSAVGDTKNEQWHIAYEQNNVVIRATSDNKLIRTYRGGFLGPGIELEAQPDSLSTPQSGKIVVRLQETKNNRLDGVREITRPDDCRIIYDLDLRKQ